MSKRILIVDDQPTCRKLVEYNLKRAGYDVMTAKNGVEALELLRGQSVDMVVSDVMMPEMDGFELCEHLQNDPSTKEIPFLFLTANAQLEAKVRGISLGAQNYITKPFEPRQLLVSVERLLQSPPLDAPAPEDEQQ